MYVHMVIFTKIGTIIKIKLLQNSNARNYFESNERYLLNTILEKLENEKSNDMHLTDKESQEIIKIFEKYKKYL